LTFSFFTQLLPTNLPLFVPPPASDPARHGHRPSRVFTYGLTSTLQSAHARGLLGTEFEARLALVELKERSGQRSAAQADLLALEEAARGKGFGLIVGKALGDSTQRQKSSPVN